VIPLGATVCYPLANRYLGRGGRLDIGDLETFADALKAKFALPGAASPEDQLKPEVAGLFVATGAKYGPTFGVDKPNRRWDFRRITYDLDEQP